MIRLAFTLFVILFYSFFISTIFKITIGRSIPLSYITLAYLMYVMSMFTRISFFKYLIVVSIILMMVYLLFLYKRKKINLKEIINLCLRPSLFVFIIFFIYLYFVLGNVQLSNIDDIGYWGTRVLDINRTDALYANEYTVFGGSNYPPFTALIEIVFIKLFGTFKQSYLILAQASFSFVLFLSLFDKYEIKDILKILITFVIVVCVTLMVQNNQSFGDHAFIYNSIYVDWLIGLITGKCLSLYYNFDKDINSSYIEMGIYEAALILVKQTALPLVVLIGVTGYIYLAIKNKRFFIKDNLKKYLIYIVGLPLIIYISWRFYFGFYGSSVSKKVLFTSLSILVAFFIVVLICLFLYKKYKQKINLKIVFYICLFLPMVLYAAALVFNSSVFGGNDNYNLSILLRFIDAYFTSSIFSHPFKISYYFISLFVTLCLLFIGQYRKKENEYYSIPVLYYFGSIGYASMILISYMFVFGYEGYTLVVFGRYMQTYTYGGIVLLALVLLSEGLNYIKMLGVVAFSLLFVEPDSVSTIIYDKDWQNYRTDAQIQALDDYFEYEYNGEKMAVFAQYDMRDLSLVGYLADEKKRNITYYGGIVEGDEERFDLAIEENEYAFVGSRDDLLVELWSKYSDEEPYNMSLYKINHDGENISIELICTWDDLK